PRSDLELVEKERSEKTIEEGRQLALDQKSEPRDRDQRHDEQCPDREHEVMRDDERGSEDHGRPTPAQWLTGFDPDATVSHARYRSGDEAGNPDRVRDRFRASRLRGRERQAADERG